MRLAVFIVLSLVSFVAHARAADWNQDGLSDLWALFYDATNLVSHLDSDGDGVPNWAESIAGTDPFDADDYHAVLQTTIASNRTTLMWYGLRGKRYDLLARTNLLDSAWIQHATQMGSNRLHTLLAPEINGQPQIFWSVQVSDVDSDGDGLSDYEEYLIGLNPFTNRSNRTVMNDSNKVRNAFSATNWVTVAAIDAAISEDWPDPGVFAIRRTGRIDRVTVPFTISGSAGFGSDYTLSTNGSITLEPGMREAWVFVSPMADAIAESSETVILTLGTSTAYRLGASISATITIANAAATNLPSTKPAARFLSQATFGVKTQEIEQVKAMGFASWITNQFALPPSFLSSYMVSVYAAYTNGVWSNHKDLAWWWRSIHSPDQLRQRVAWALSQIFVISDGTDRLANEVDCMISYYDMLIGRAFANFYDLLIGVTLHPAMGIYLSHMGNEKADPAAGRFPDENYAREIMQLFSIGLWELNPDGTRKLTNGLPIPTYQNSDITELARVFTGLSWPQGNTNIWWEFYWPTSYALIGPMRMWGEYHDTNSKVLLRGRAIPAGNPPMRDVEIAVSNLFWHPNTPPFICRQLIQRFTTSNPSTGYVWRVASAFTNNGAGVRGDMKAVIRAILLDPEARDPSNMSDPAWGKLREPYLRPVHLGRTFNAASSNQFLEMWWLDDIYAMRPLGSPSVFNFYSPNFMPSGPLKTLGRVAPEFQIVNDVTAVMAVNHMYTAVEYGGLNRWAGDPETNVRLDLAPLIARAADLDAMIAWLDGVLTYGTLEPAHHQMIREALQRIPASDPEARARMALYLFATSPAFAVLK